MQLPPAATSPGPDGSVPVSPADDDDYEDEGLYNELANPEYQPVVDGDGNGDGDGTGAGGGAGTGSGKVPGGTNSDAGGGSPGEHVDEAYDGGVYGYTDDALYPSALPQPLQPGPVPSSGNTNNNNNGNGNTIGEANVLLHDDDGTGSDGEQSSGGPSGGSSLSYVTVGVAASGAAVGLAAIVAAVALVRARRTRASREWATKDSTRAPAAKSEESRMRASVWDNSVQVDVAAGA